MNLSFLRACEERVWFVRKMPEINMYSRKLNRYVMQDVLTTLYLYVHYYISESVRHLHVFNNNLAVPDMLQTMFFNLYSLCHVRSQSGFHINK